MGVGGGVDDDGGELALGFLNPAYEFSFEIRLSKIHFRLQLNGALANLGFDLGKREPAIDFRFAGAEQVEVRSVEKQNLHEGESITRRFFVELN